jgi:hypothetical protein
VKVRADLLMWVTIASLTLVVGVMSQTVRIDWAESQ